MNTTNTINLRQYTELQSTLFKAKNLEDLPNKAFELGFFMYSYDQVEPLTGFVFDEEYKDFEFLIRHTSGDEFDKKYIFALQYVQRNTESLLVFINGLLLQDTNDLKWSSKKEINHKKVKKAMIFSGMTHRDRALWRAEHRRYLKNPQLEKSEFYTKNAHFCKILDPKLELPNSQKAKLRVKKKIKKLS